MNQWKFGTECLARIRDGVRDEREHARGPLHNPGRRVLVFGMPYVSHDKITTPPDDTVLWRYLSFVRFMELIEGKKLWFSRVDKFEDPLEGTHTDAEIFKSWEPGLSGQPPSSDLPSDKQEFVVGLAPLMHYVSCWREGEDESMAMWDVYGKGEGTVAIQSTVGQLKESLAPEPRPIILGRVNYVHWHLEKSGLKIDPISICFRKDQSYKHEAEVRAAILDPENPTIAFGQSKKGDSMSDVKAKITPGIEVGFDPAKYVNHIVVGPKEHSRTQDLVEAILKRYGLSWEVTASTVSEVAPDNSRSQPQCNYFSALFTFAHRAFCAAAILARPAALILRLPGLAGLCELVSPPSSALAIRSRASSASMSWMILSMAGLYFCHARAEGLRLLPAHRRSPRHPGDQRPQTRGKAGRQSEGVAADDQRQGGADQGGYHRSREGAGQRCPILGEAGGGNPQ